MRIALVCRFPFGQSWYTFSLAKVLQEKNVKVLLYGPKNKDQTRYYKPVWSPITYFIEITTKAIRDHVNIVHVQFEFPMFKFVFAFFLPLMCILLRLVGKKVIITLHGPIFPRGTNECELRLITPYTWVPVVLIKLFILTIYLLLDRFATFLVVHARVFKRWLSQYGVSKVTVIPHGVIDYQPGKCHGEESRKWRYLLYFGVISPRKGLEILLRAVKKLEKVLVSKDINLIIAGTPPSYYFEYFRQMLRRIKYDETLSAMIRYISSVNDNKLKRLIESAIVVILPYRAAISASGSLALCIGLGKPVIVPRLEYFEEVLGRSYPGFFRADDSNDLARKILLCVNNDSYLDLLERRITSLKVHYSWKRVADIHLNLYKKMLIRKI